MNGCPQTYVDNAINGFFNNIHGPRTKIATNARNVSVLWYYENVILDIRNYWQIIPSCLIKAVFQNPKSSESLFQFQS